MRDISLQDLLEAGCHFGHKVTRWHPKAASFIYQPREGVHIIDLVKTRDYLKRAGEYLFELGNSGKTVLFIASKRQAKGVVSEAARKAGIPYMTNRWIGGLITNWEAVKKNIDKLNNWKKERTEGVWEKYPKHEVVKMNKNLRQVEMIYGGVAELIRLPDAMVIIDINKEDTALKEAARKTIPTVAIVDTNANPDIVDYPIPANDDAVGSIQYIVNYLTDAYVEGRTVAEKKLQNNQVKAEKTTDKKREIKAEEGKPEKKEDKKVKAKTKKISKK